MDIVLLYVSIMGRKAIDYMEGKIYAILKKGVNLEDADGMVYIGSTVHYLAMRFGGHITEYVSGNAHCTSKELFEEYGVDNCEIILIENYPCKTKRELETREGQHQRTIKCVNKIIAGRTKAQYAVERREFILEQKIVFYNTNKEAILVKQKEYEKKNREVILARKRVYTAAHKTEKVAYDKIRRGEKKEEIAAAKKKYHEDNREKISEKNKVKYEGNKHKLKEQIVCQCGTSCAKYSLRLHMKSKKHATLMEALALQDHQAHAPTSE